MSQHKEDRRVSAKLPRPMLYQLVNIVVVSLCAVIDQAYSMNVFDLFLFLFLFYFILFL